MVSWVDSRRLAKGLRSRVLSTLWVPFSKREASERESWNRTVLYSGPKTKKKEGKLA